MYFVSQDVCLTTLRQLRILHRVDWIMHDYYERRASRRSEEVSVVWRNWGKHVRKAVLSCEIAIGDLPNTNPRCGRNNNLTIHRFVEVVKPSGSQSVGPGGGGGRARDGYRKINWTEFAFRNFQWTLFAIIHHPVVITNFITLSIFFN
jgi:hypothetical protein